jgi:hypothetical protein
MKKMMILVLTIALCFRASGQIVVALLLVTS